MVHGGPTKTLHLVNTPTRVDQLPTELGLPRADITARTPLAMFLKLRPDQKAGSMISRRRPLETESADESLTPETQAGPKELQIESRTDLLQAVRKLRSDQIEVSATVTADRTSAQFDLWKNLSIERFVDRVIAAADGNFNAIQLHANDDHAKSLEVFYQNLIIDTFPGLFPTLGELQRALAHRLELPPGETLPEDALLSWFSLLPEPQELGSYSPIAQANVVRVLEEMAASGNLGKQISHCAAQYLGKLPDYQPSETGMTCEMLWNLTTSREIFEGSTGLAVHEVKTPEQLLRACKIDALGDRPPEALFHYLDVCKLAGNEEVLKLVLLPLLTTEIPGCNDSRLAAVGMLTMQAIDSIQARS